MVAEWRAELGSKCILLITAKGELTCIVLDPCPEVSLDLLGHSSRMRPELVLRI